LSKAWKKNEGLTWRFLRRRLHLAAWREPLLLLASQLDNTEFIKLIHYIKSARSQYENILYRDQILAATLIGENNFTDSDLLKTYIELLRRRKSYIESAPVDALSGIGMPAVPALLDALKNQDPSVRSGAASALGNIGDPQVIPALLDALKDQDGSVRSEAVNALGFIRDPQVIPALLEALKDQDGSVRSGAASALGYTGDPQVIPALLDALKDQDGSVRSGAARSLGYIGDPQVIPALLDALKDEDPSVRSGAASALGNIGDPQVIPALLEALKDKDESVRLGAVEALGQITRKWQSTTIPTNRVVQIQILRKIVEALLPMEKTTFDPGIKFIRSSILEQLENLVAPQFDPLNPPPPPKWVKVLRNVGLYLLIASLLTLAGLATFAITTAQGSLKGLLEKWYQSQPIVVILVLIMSLTTLTIMLKPMIDKLYTRIKN
jgi:hypothetical protein